MLIGPGAVQDGLGIVLVRSFFRLAVWVRFFEPLRLLLGPSWGALGPVLGCLELSWAALVFVSVRVPYLCCSAKITLQQIPTFRNTFGTA